MDKNFLQHYIISSLIAAFLAVALIIGSAAYILKSDSKKVYVDYHSAVSFDALKKDTLNVAEPINLKAFVDRVDSIAQRTSYINGRYQDDINLMIYKTTQWLTFWLAIFGIVIGFLSVLNIVTSHRNDSRFDKLKDDFFKDISQHNQLADQRMNVYINNINSRFELYKDQAKKEATSQIESVKMSVESLNNDLNKVKEKIKITDQQNIISSLMTCIVNFPDPSMFNSKPDRKRSIRYYMDKLNKDFESYVNMLNTKEKMEKDELIRLSIVLSSIKFAAIRSWNVFSPYHQNVVYHQFVEKLDAPIMSIVNGGVDLDMLCEDIKEVSRLFDQLIQSISIDDTYAC